MFAEPALRINWLPTAKPHLLSLVDDDIGVLFAGLETINYNGQGPLAVRTSSKKVFDTKPVTSGLRHGWHEKQRGTGRIIYKFGRVNYKLEPGNVYFGSGLQNTEIYDKLMSDHSLAFDHYSYFLNQPQRSMAWLHPVKIVY